MVSSFAVGTSLGLAVQISMPRPGDQRRSKRLLAGGVQDIHGVNHVGDYVARRVLVVGPSAAVDPDRAQTGCLPSADVRDEVVTDHPAPAGETRTAPLGGDLEQARLRLANALDTRESIG